MKSPLHIQAALKQPSAGPFGVNEAFQTGTKPMIADTLYLQNDNGSYEVTWVPSDIGNGVREASFRVISGDEVPERLTDWIRTLRYSSGDQKGELLFEPHSSYTPQ